MKKSKQIKKLKKQLAQALKVIALQHFMIYQTEKESRIGVN